MSSYPAAQLLPRPTYRLLSPVDVPTGWLLRRTDRPPAFMTAANGRTILQDANQLCDEPKHLGDGFSVNLWGHFEKDHVGWKLVPGNKEAVAKIRQLWVPPQPTAAPTAEEMYYLPSDQWSLLGLSISNVRGCWLDVSGYGKFEAVVCHAPNCWNFWHYEVRFRNAAGQWLHDYPGFNPRPCSLKQLKLLHEGLRASFVEKGLVALVAADQAPAPLGQPLYDTAA